MIEPHELYTVEADVAAELSATAQAPVLLHVLRGFVDAGGAAELVSEHLLERFPARRLVTFDVDQLLDYRARRPMMTFDVSRWRDYDAPQLVVDVLHDAEGTPFLLLHGLEPDVQWERFAAAVREVVERFGVSLTIGLNGIPMGVPHTRPVAVTAHGTRPDLVDSIGWFGTVQVPASIGSVLEYRLGRWGHDAVGFAVHVPHYLAGSGFPPAAVAGLRNVEDATGLALDAPALEPAARRTLAAVDRQVAGSEDVATVVRALEEHYDTLARTLGKPNLLSGAVDLPTADEIGADFERYLAEQPPSDGA
jgi:hypothetical protein